VDRTTQPRLGECRNKRQIFVTRLKIQTNNKCLFVCTLKQANKEETSKEHKAFKFKIEAHL